MTGGELASGERVVRRYSCTAVDRVALIAGTVIPLPGSVESEGVLTLTNKRIIFELEADMHGRAGMRQEASLKGVSSFSSMMSKFGRDLRVPILFIVVGFLLIFAPFVALTQTGAMGLDGEYQDGFNYGVESGYFGDYLRAVQDGRVSHDIPDGYHFTPMTSVVSSEYYAGFEKGSVLGAERAQSDIAADAPFSVPYDLMTHHNPTGLCVAVAVAGAVVFVMGSVLYLVSNTTKDWISVNLGSGGRGIVVKSFNGGWRSTGYRALTAENQYWDMTRELGAAILEIKDYREHRVRFVEEDDDVIIDSQDEPAGDDREMLPPALGFDDFDDLEGGELIIDDDDDEDIGPRIVGPDWRE